MAVTRPSVTLPTVVEELLSEMAAAMRESAQSTSIAGREPRPVGRGGEWQCSVWACGALDSVFRPRAPCRRLLKFFSHVVLSPNPLVFKTERKKKVESAQGST